MKARTFSIAKLEQESINEDSAIANDSVIAVSDGAGGGGVYAEKWSEYLLEKLPLEPISTFEELDSWMDSIWEQFYNECEKKATQGGGMLLNKFYDEGSFATLVAIWKGDDNRCKWMSYGDSVAFHYNTRTKILEHSFSSISDFDKPPYLLNCKDPIDSDGFRSGEFIVDDDSIVFCASDALSFYVLLLYELANCNVYHTELENLERANTKNSNHLKMALSLNLDFHKQIGKLINCKSKINFERHLRRLLKIGVLSLDDYSISILPINLDNLKILNSGNPKSRIN